MAEKTCTDPHCFRHGSLRTRGGEVTGLVVSDKGRRSVIVEREYTRRIPKYERLARKRSRIPAHNPDCIAAKEGDTVRIAECRRISKTKAWTVVEVLGRRG
ncbi:MAG: 30S ribosomal protein S17 [Candidatus Micrarchaeia archaeon]